MTVSRMLYNDIVHVFSIFSLDVVEKTFFFEDMRYAESSNKDGTLQYQVANFNGMTVFYVNQEQVFSMKDDFTYKTYNSRYADYGVTLMSLINEIRNF